MLAQKMLSKEFWYCSCQNDLYCGLCKIIDSFLKYSRLIDWKDKQLKNEDLAVNVVRKNKKAVVYFWMFTRKNLCSNHCGY